MEREGKRNDERGGMRLERNTIKRRKIKKRNVEN